MFHVVSKLDHSQLLPPTIRNYDTNIKRTRTNEIYNVVVIPFVIIISCENAAVCVGNFSSLSNDWCLDAEHTAAVDLNTYGDL